MVANNIEIIVIPREDQIPDLPINFPPLHNLQLHLLENKHKLKAGVKNIDFPQDLPTPKNVSSKKVDMENQDPQVPKEKKSKKKKQDIAEKSSNDEPLKISIEPEELSKKPKRRKREKTKKLRKPKKPKVAKEDKDLVRVLGEDDEDDILDEEDDLIELDELEEGDLDEDLADEDEENLEENAEDDPTANMTPEEKEAYHKEEMIWRFRILKKKYKNANIPEFNEHSDLALMKRTYDRTLKDLTLDDSVSSYKTYLTGGFMAIEFLGTKFLNIDLMGFTSAQMIMMEKYERLLIELGEKSYLEWGNKFPIELRLVGFIILQAGMFYIAKIISEKMGNTVGDIFRGMMGQPISSGQPANNQPAEETSKSKKKMRGPSVKASEIRKQFGKEEEDDTSDKEK